MLRFFLFDLEIARKPLQDDIVVGRTDERLARFLRSDLIPARIIFN